MNARHLVSQLVKHLVQLVTRAAKTNNKIQETDWVSIRNEYRMSDSVIICEKMIWGRA